jgi:uncharacterized membrane protein
VMRPRAKRVFATRGAFSVVLMVRTHTKTNDRLWIVVSCHVVCLVVVQFLVVRTQN